MKFGDTLVQRSVPQWRTYNIDYNQIKHLIKEHTTPGKGKAVSIPGRGDELGQRFEDQLFALLKEECDRISLFVRSKRYELDSRLGSIGRQLDLVAQKGRAADNATKALRLRQRYSRIESDILAVGEEIRKLSRFTSINRTAVRKLLKKHAKWSGSQTLRPKVEEDILKRPDCFSKKQIMPALEKYTAYLERVRSPYAPVEPSSRRGSATLDGATDSLSDDMVTPCFGRVLKGKQRFDDSLEDSKQQDRHLRAVFWVHPDNLMELKVLLLQHLQKARQTSSGHASPNSSSYRSFPDEKPEEQLTCLLLDDEARLTSAGGQEDISSQVDATWAPKTSVRVYCETQNDPSNTTGDGSSADLKNTLTQQLPPRIVCAGIAPLAARDDHTDEESEEQQNQKSLSMQQVWDAVHTPYSLKPLAHATRSRARYLGLSASSDTETWAALDESVSYSRLRIGEVQTGLDVAELLPKEVTRSFPYAILTMVSKQQGPGSPTAAFTQSHLTERVDGFSIESHALAALFGANGSSQPSWFSSLDKDIRHLPSQQESTSKERQPSSLGQLSSASSTLQGTPRLGNSADNSPLAMNAASFPQATKQSQQLQQDHDQKYWNEYDNPESDAGDGFAIYVDPDAPIFPGQKTLARWYNAIASKLSSPKRKSKPRNTLKRSPSADSLTSTSSDEDADDELSAYRPATARKPLLPHFRPGYGALSHGHNAYNNLQDDTTIFSFFTNPFTSTLLLLASLLILLISTFMTFTSRRKLRGEVDIAVVVGVVAALAFMGIAAIRWWTVELLQRGDLVNNFGREAQRRRTVREWLRLAGRRVGDVVKVSGIVVIVLGSVFLLFVVFQ